MPELPPAPDPFFHYTADYLELEQDPKVREQLALHTTGRVVFVALPYGVEAVVNSLLRGAAAEEYPDLPGPAATVALVLLARAYGVTPEVRQ